MYSVEDLRGVVRILQLSVEWSARLSCSGAYYAETSINEKLNWRIQCIAPLQRLAYLVETLGWKQNLIASSRLSLILKAC